jgi:hypothetical protein
MYVEDLKEDKKGLEAWPLGSATGLMRKALPLLFLQETYKPISYL